MIIPGMNFENMMGGGFPIAAPFTLSGSWETGMEGWSPNEGRINSPSQARTGDFRLGTISSSPQVWSLTLPASEVAGLVITASVWGQRLNSGHTARLGYRIGSSAFVNLASTTNATYTLLSGSFLHNRNSPITFELVAENSALFDDWSISGALP